MLRDFLTENRPELIERCRAKVAKRRAPRATPDELEHGVPLFLAQLTQMLPTGLDGSNPLAESQIEVGATRHGDELLRNDFTIEQVVHDYGDLCQSITELAVEQAVPITAHEFGILNIRLDNAIAGAVTEYTRQHQIVTNKEGVLATNERLGVLAHEMRNLLNTTILAISAMKRGSVGLGGATAGALDRSLLSMRGLIDRTLAEVRLQDETAPFHEVIELGPFIAHVQVAASLEASAKGCVLKVPVVAPGVFVVGDRHILAAAVANLLHNAFRHTRPDSHVLLAAHTAAGRVYIDVQDESSGTFEQRSADRSGAGAGLAISRRGVEAMGGTLTARDLPDKGCLFTIDLPEKRWATP
jgi:signal transduction histidine kinase